MNITGLTIYTTYYVRAYAINEAGTAYGNEVSFTASPCYTISVLANPTNGGSVSGGGTYNQGQSCTVYATANSDYIFANWTENGNLISTNPEYSFTVLGDHSLVANFFCRYVDLGLPSGRLWATCNVGAESPEDYGDYYAWGETGTKYYLYEWSNYQYSYHTATWGNPMLTKYCTIASYGANGFVDNLTALQSGDDVATTEWGTPWHIPTKEDWIELINNTTHVWTTRNGVNGYLFTASNGNHLFLPASGVCNGSNHPNTGSVGQYWSKSLRTDHPSSAWYFDFDLDNCNNMGTSQSRYIGLSVRPVR